MRKKDQEKNAAFGKIAEHIAANPVKPFVVTKTIADYPAHKHIAEILLNHNDARKDHIIQLEIHDSSFIALHDEFTALLEENTQLLQENERLREFYDAYKAWAGIDRGRLESSEGFQIRLNESDMRLRKAKEALTPKAE